MATQRLLRTPRRGVAASRPTDAMVQIISMLSAQRRELRAWAGDRLRLLDARTSAAAPRHIELTERLARIEGRLERARLAQSGRAERRRERIVRLSAVLEMLRGPAAAQAAENARRHQLGSVLMYVGGLVVLWVILLEVGLALGLR